MQRELNKYDILKAGAILLVVIGHITRLYRSEVHPEINTKYFELITRSIYTFHMPLFMALSGVLYGLKKESYVSNVKSFLINKVNRLLIPYITGAIVLTAVLVYIGEVSLQPGEISSILYNIFCFQNIKHLWFILALFQIFVIQILCDRLNIPILISLTISLVTGIIYKTYFTGYAEFACTHMALQYWPYFIIGNIIIQYPINSIKKIYAYSCFIPILIYFRHIAQSSALRAVAEYTIAILIILLIVYILDYVDISKISNKFKLATASIADTSFAIYLFHVPALFLFHDYFTENSVSLLITVPMLFILSIIVPIIIIKLFRTLGLSTLLREKHGHYTKITV